MTEQLQAALEILRRAQNPFVPGSAEHWALEEVCRTPQPVSDKVQAYLEKYQAALHQEKELRLELCALEARMGAGRSLIKLCEPGESDKISLLAERMLEQKKKMICQMEQSEQLRRNITRMVEQLNDPRLRLVLKYRYLHSYSWETIAETMNISSKWARKLHRDALAQLCEERMF